MLGHLFYSSHNRLLLERLFCFHCFLEPFQFSFLVRFELLQPASNRLCVVAGRSRLTLFFLVKLVKASCSKAGTVAQNYRVPVSNLSWGIFCL